MRSRVLACVWFIGSVMAPLAAQAAEAPPAYAFSTKVRANETVVLDGRNLDVASLARIAREGARVELSASARERSRDAYGLLLQAAAEGVPVYWFNRGSGSQRETVIFDGDPTSPENVPLIRERQRTAFARGGGAYGPEVDHEDVVRAMMAVRASTMTYEAASPQLTQMLVDMLNAGITPVVHTQGTVGEGDLALMGEIGQAMIGLGEVHYGRARLPAADALRAAGLRPLVPFGADDAALTSTNAYFVAQAALLVSDARRLLEWSDIATAMALLGMNSSVTPLTMPVQHARPYPWLNWDAARVLDMVRDSYLFQTDATRIIQDPESLRASTQRAGSAWQALEELHAAVLVAMNSSDHNPAVLPGVRPGDSWELSTPQLMRFHVKGGALSGGKGGYVLSTANWDPYPLANEVEAFTIALANLDVVFTQRIERFHNPFFTGVAAQDVLPPGQLSAMPKTGGYLPVDLWAEIVGLINPVVPQGQPVVSSVEDLQAMTRLKVARARRAVDLSGHLLAQDLLTSSKWMDVRRAQDPARRFGSAPSAALVGLRAALAASRGSGTAPGKLVYEFMASTPASTYYPAGPAAPWEPRLAQRTR